MLDEYDGDTLEGSAQARTDKPMTLGELGDFFLEAWPLIDVLKTNYKDDVGASLAFFEAKSEFYPDFNRLCRRRVIDHLPAPKEKEDTKD